ALLWTYTPPKSPNTRYHKPHQSALPASIETQKDLACIGTYQSALPASIGTQADLAFTESALHFQF
ncbi:hypothetical protein HMPREF1584_01359, partial [Gardnerella vaginalis JCP8481A]